MKKFLKPVSLGLLLGTAHRLYADVFSFVWGELKDMLFQRPDDEVDENDEYDEDDNIVALVKSLEAQFDELNKKTDALAKSTAEA